jgi:cytochrome c553
MNRLLKNTILFGIFSAALLALLRSFGAGAARKAGHPQADERRSNAKRYALTIAVFLIAAASGGFLIVAAGLVPTTASSGHWPITAALLNFAMRRSVILHSLGIESPPLNDNALVLKGAGHYEIGCSPCHGSPALRQPVIAQRMTPHPPDLANEVVKWDAEELFYIVKHGIKFTGMPAWPAQERDDEVWAMVAFLRTLPQLDADKYRQLIHGDVTANQSDVAAAGFSETADVARWVTDNCARCHGRDGLGRDSHAFPKLAGQNPNYFYLTMQAYAHGQRNSGIMEPIAAALPPEVIPELARYYAVRKPPAQSAPSVKNRAAIERGKQIAEQGIPNQRVPICVECHGPGPDRKNPNYPELAGQYAEYLILQLTLFKKQQRGGTRYAHLMRRVAHSLTDRQMRDVASYYESLSSVTNYNN